MPEFLNLQPPDEARQRFVDAISHRMGVERVESMASRGRTLAVDVIAPEDSPAFPRSTVDGYAVRSVDTHGTSDSLPAFLRLSGEVPMGGTPKFEVGRGECALIHTGGMMPPGADAVLMLEHAQRVGDGEIEGLRALANGENTLLAGEDVARGAVVLGAGARLGPAEIGGLMALGITEVEVRTRPKVGILSTGDEVIPPDKFPMPGQVRDVNSHSLAARAEMAGGEPHLLGIVPDDEQLLGTAAAAGLAQCDVLVITAGSSASARDLTAQVIGQLGKPGVLVHGVNVRPGKPTILGVCGGKPVLGLPGNPVSALVIAQLFLIPALNALLGNLRLHEAAVIAELSLNVASVAGREDWIPVRLHEDGERVVAEPVFGKSNLIFGLARADGFVRISPDQTGLSAGESVGVLLFQR